MKKVVVVAAMLSLCAGSAFAASNIAATKHNISSGSTQSIKSSNQGQICMFLSHTTQRDQKYPAVEPYRSYKHLQAVHLQRNLDPS